MMPYWNRFDFRELDVGELITIFESAKERLFIWGWERKLEGRTSFGICIEEAITGNFFSANTHQTAIAWAIVNSQINGIIWHAIYGITVDVPEIGLAWLWNDCKCSGFGECMDVLDRCIELSKEMA